MDERLLKYRSKIDYILEKLENFPIITDNDLLIDGIIYRVQTSIEAATDLAAMLVKDLGIGVEDDYTNLEKLREKEIISRGLEDKLKKLNGLRNLLVHRYCEVDVEIVLDSLNEVKEILYEFIEIIEGIINETYKENKRRS
ncbi:MAG: DUF86 domain-containing protein [Methanosarcinales archaeon]